jgi:Protein of unknown function (DUF3383)
MSQLDQTIQVNISRETTAVARAAFNVPCFVATHTAFNTRTKEYTSLSAVLLDFPTTTNVYKAATGFFSQERKPPKIVIGRRQVNSVSATISSVVVGAVYSITVNGTLVSYTAQSGDTPQVIIDGLEAAYGGSGVVGVNFLDNTGSFSLTVVTTGADWSVKSSSNIALSLASPTETWADTMNAVRSSSNAFYGVTTEDHTNAGILAVAAWASTSNVIHGASTQSADVLTNATTDVASQLNDLSYTRTFLLYSKTADSVFPECAWMGDRLPPVAGTAQWIFATLIGVAPDKLTDDEIANLNNKKCNYYIDINDVGVTKKGWVSSGNFIEETILIDWTKSRIQERLLFRMVNSLKLPSDNTGLAIIQNDIYSVLAEGVRNGGFAKSPAPYVYVPDILDIDPNLRAQGIITDIKFRARMVISITEIIIEGTVTI